jgi:NAD(P)-dependent dehydrogenase (short-subunit alcohol dehydrogenase family)
MTVVVTGAAGGIGQAASEAFTSAGSVVVGQDLAPTERTGLQLAGDLCDADVLESVSSAVAGEELDAVVAAHGIAGAGSLEELTTEDGERIMRVNFESVVLLWERLRPQLEATGGSFVVVASQAGLKSEANNGVYSASKSALSGWLRGLAPQTPARLRLVHPGATRTPLLESALRGMASARGVSYETVMTERNAGTPAGRLGEPSEIGAAIHWLAGLRTRDLVELAITGGEVLH